MYETILQAFPLPALIIGADGRIDDANSGATKIFGQGILGRHYITGLRHPTLLEAIDNAALNNTTENAIFLSTDAHREITFRISCAPLTDKSILVSLEDRTDFEDAGQMRRDFVANVSHELKTPLTALIGFIETLRGPARNDESARSRFLEIMAREAGRMDRLVNDLLSLSRVEAAERVRPKDMVNLSGVVNSILGTLSSLADEANVNLEQKGTDQPLEVAGDADQLNQIVTNLVENAIKYIGHGDLVTVSLSDEPNNRALRCHAIVLTVADNGPGIDPVHIPRLTERFYRSDDHRSRELGGTGLGLAIVKHIVNRHRGRLNIKSELGKGAEFSVILPKYANNTS